MTRCFQTLLALDLTIGLGSFPRERASVVQSFYGAPHAKSFNGQARRKPVPARNVLSHAGSRLQRNDTSISKRLRKRFDNEYWRVARMLDQAPEYCRAL